MGNLLSFEGRVRRRDWWLYNVVVALLSTLVTQVVAPMVFGDEGRVRVDPSSPFTPTYPMPLLGVMLVFALVFLWPSFAMAAKRAHDRGNSARVTIILFTVSTVLGWAGLVGSSLDAGLGGLMWVALPINLIIGIYLLVVLGFLDGTPGPNAYGPSPKGLGGPSADTFS